MDWKLRKAVSVPVQCSMYSGTWNNSWQFEMLGQETWVHMDLQRKGDMSGAPNFVP